MILKSIPMARIAILGLKKDRQSTISILHDLEVLQLEPLSKDISPLLKSERDDVLARKVSDQLLRVRALLTVLPKTFATIHKQFKITDELLESANSIEIDDKVLTLEKEKESLLTEIKDAQNNITLVEKFVFFTEDLRILKLSSANSYFGNIATEKFEAFEKALQKYKQDMFLYSKKQKDTTNLILVVFPNFSSDAFADIIQTHEAKIETIPNLDGTPNEIIKNQKNKLENLNQKLEHINDELTQISNEHYANLTAIEEQLAIENKKLEVISNLGTTDDAFALEGWTPKSKINQIQITLKKHTTGTTIYELQTKEKPPTLLNNSKKFRLYEAFIRFYSLPQSKEFDPTMIFAIIFPIFYGLMIGDVGYCVFILLVCLWVIRRVEKGKRNLNIMPKQLRSFALLILKKRQMVKLAKAMIPGCIIGIIFGVIFDLYFGFHLNGYLFDYLGNFGITGFPAPGDVLNRPTQAFFDPIHNAGTLLLYAGYTGIGMVSLGLILGILNCLREGEKKEAIGKIGWLAFGWGVVLVGLALIHGDALNPTWPRLIEVNPIAFLYYGLLFGGIGLMFVGEGARAIMELASIVSHILSYTRLVGILLASVILAHTIDFIFLKALNISIPFIILGTIILIVGHLFNTIIGVFEPGIQGARLVYVEFFSKFYHGNGKKFNPFGSRRIFTKEQYEIEPNIIQSTKKSKTKN